jgi:mono/diheme cytochrome c family protein
MPDGSGVPNMQPALQGSGMLAGEPAALIRLVLYGGDAVLPENRPRFENPMPPLAALSDQQVADVIGYARRMFAKAASPIAARDVAAQRAKP